jgi:signal transduction protein with GAF and PtsI domain
VPAEDLPIAHLTELCASIRELFDAKACVCAVVDHAAGRLEFVAGDGAGVGLLMGQRLLVGEGIAGYVAQAGVPVEVPRVREDDRWQAGLPVHAEYVPEGLLGVPVTGADGRVVGVLQVLDPSPDVAAEAQSAVGGPLPALAVVAAELAQLLGRRTS